MAAEPNRSQHKIYKSYPLEVTPSAKHQKTISQLFTSSQEEQSQSSTEFSPITKRRKRSSASATRPPSATASIVEMYNFSTFRSNAEDAIDLTGSPPNVSISPQRKARRLSLTARVDNSSPLKSLKRLPVKNLRSGPRTDPSEYCNKASAQLTEALTAIFDNRRPQLSNEELYRASENLCKLGRAPETTKILLERCKQHISTDFLQPLLSQSGLDDIGALKAVLDTWSVWNMQLVG